jgi:hypothetical protein
MAMEEEEEQGSFFLPWKGRRSEKDGYRPWKVTISTAAIFLAMIPMKVKLYIYITVREGTRKEGSVGH